MRRRISGVWLLGGLGGALPLVVAPAVAAAAGGGEEPGIINLNVTILIQVVNFLILILLLSKFLWKPLTAFLEARAAGIRESLAEAAAAREAAARAEEAHQAQLLVDRREAAQLREQVQREVEAERQRLLAASRAETQRMVAEARSAIETETRRAREALRAETVELSLAVAERLLGRALTAEDQQRLAAEFIRALGEKP
ncbi:MAG: F0F1 ATP synthase subunit B [Candidatus Methylomirabilota bacterium]